MALLPRANLCGGVMTMGSRDKRHSELSKEDDEVGAAKESG